MGLDMYLIGEKYHWTNWEKPEEQRMEDGKKVKTVEVELGYWRKHPNLHGFIVNEFAKGEDNCERIGFSEEDLLKLREAVEKQNLPPTQGFFFGSSDGSETEEDLKILDEAIAWAKTEEKGVWRTVYYKASW